MAAEGNSLTTLYVEDLEESVREEELRRLFDQAVSIRIGFNEDRQPPLRFGYVHFSNPQDAEKALELLNFAQLKGRSIRIAYSVADGSFRTTDNRNIFVKNLDKIIDNKALHDLFSPFGKILSCKVMIDSLGISRGYGYVFYIDEESATRAIKEMHNLTLHKKKLHVAPYVSKQERDLSIDRTKFTNVYVKNLAESTAEEDLRSIFGEIGATTSIAVMRDETGRSKCFGFVNFEKAEDAAKSIELLNGKQDDGNKWYVGRAMTKSEREREMNQSPIMPPPPIASHPSTSTPHSAPPPPFPMAPVPPLRMIVPPFPIPMPPPPLPQPPPNMRGFVYQQQFGVGRPSLMTQNGRPPFPLMPPFLVMHSRPPFPVIHSRPQPGIQPLQRH